MSSSHLAPSRSNNLCMQHRCEINIAWKISRLSKICREGNLTFIKPTALAWIRQRNSQAHQTFDPMVDANPATSITWQWQGQTVTYPRAGKRERSGTTHEIVKDFKSQVGQRQTISSSRVLSAWFGCHCLPSTLYSRISKCHPGINEATPTAQKKPSPQSLV